MVLMANIMPPLSQQEYQALKASIEKNGVLVPVEVDEETGELLDGHHRMQICQELGIEAPITRRRFAGDKERKEHALTLNLMRRHLGPISWAESFKKLAEVRGVRLGRGGDRKSTATVAVDTVQDLAAEVGVADRTARYRLNLAEELATEPDLAGRVDAGEMDAKKALRQKRERDQRRKSEEQPPVTHEEAAALQVEVRHCDFRQMDLPESSVDAIITDPPYPAEYLPLYDDLAYEASRLLKPGGVLVCMVGQSYLPELYGKLSEHLTYHWTVAYTTPGGQNTQMFHRKVNTFWKPVLIYSNGEYGGEWIGDVVKSPPTTGEKAHHDLGWGQGAGGMVQLIERFSKPGDLVYDPFLGGGGTAIVCASTGRRFVGCDLEERHVETTRKRLAGLKEAS